MVDAKRIYIGAVYEDSSGYPDCRPEYYAAFNEVIRLGTAAGDIRIETPIIFLTKEQIIRKGLELHAPLNLTWSCYQREDIACGVCDSCGLRLRGFQQAGVEDPISYAVRPDYTPEILAIQSVKTTIFTVAKEEPIQEFALTC